MNPDVLIVGAGPVGLFTAVEAKLHNPALKIKILERNKEYSRYHILRLEQESLDNSLAYKKYAAVRELNGFVPTADIENTFLNIAQELGIEVERGVTVSDSSALLEQYPSAHTLIGADGAHSVIRRQLFNDKKIVDKNLQYIIELKYKAKNNPQRLPATTYGAALGQISHLLTENVGKEKEGETPVSLFIFVSEATYNEIRGKRGLQLANLKPTSKRMHKLLNTIRPWLSLRREALNEELILGSEKINGVALNVFQSSSFAKKINNKTVYLVGDAAAGVPYFRALNAGLLAAALTAKAIGSKTEPNLTDLNAQLSRLMRQEIKNARKTNGKVNIGRVVNFVLANVSKIMTGALLKPTEQAAMLNARIEKTNILRRNPRTLEALSFCLLTIAILACCSMSIVPLGTASLISILGGIGITLVSSLLVKIILFMSERIKERHWVRRAPELPWEVNYPHQSLRALSQLSEHSVNKSSDVQEEDVTHYPSLFNAPTMEIAETVVERHNHLARCA